MVLWAPFTKGNVTYDLTHLHPKTLTFEQPAKENRPSRKYVVEVEFGLHCFTCGFEGDDNIDRELIYSDARESRLFDFDRYELSKRLLEIVENLPSRKCYHTDHGNFFTVEMIKSNGTTAQYEVYFTLSRSSKKGSLNLYVQSAYVRDCGHKTNQRRKSVGFFVLLFNTLTDRPIKPAPQ
jgi:hypothetical protein